MFKVKNPLTFSNLRKPLASSYKDTKGVQNYFRNSSYSRDVLDLSTFVDGSDLDEYFRRPGSQNEACRKISNTLYDTNRIYGELLDYLSNIYYWHYTVTPRKMKNGTPVSKEEYKKIYSSMLDIAEGISIETVFPLLLLQIFKNGCVNFCTNYNNASKTLNTIILPYQYCKPTFLTQYGTQLIKFDVSFFDSMGLKSDEIDYLLSTFPPEFEEAYRLYKASGNSYRWVEIDGKHATCISMNDEGFPTLLSTFYDLLDYKTYKINELDRNMNQLERIVTQEIDMESTGLDMEEIAALHDDLSPVICNNKGSTLVTTPGKIEVHQLQEDLNKENSVLANSYKTIFDNAGLNNNIFSGDSDLSLKTSLNRDLQFVWSYVKKIEVFYNLTINNYKNFKGYQLSLKILPTSPYNEESKLNELHQAATLGVGVLDYIVATGTKQVDLESTIELEEFLHLSDRLKPLQSSHTQSSTSDADNKSKEDESADEEVGTDKEQTEPEGSTEVESEDGENSINKE